MPTNCSICSKSVERVGYGDLSIINSFGSNEKSLLVIKVDRMCDICAEKISDSITDYFRLTTAINTYIFYPLSVMEDIPKVRSEKTKWLKDFTKSFCKVSLYEFYKYMIAKVKRDLKISDITSEEFMSLDPEDLLEEMEFIANRSGEQSVRRSRPTRLGATVASTSSASAGNSTTASDRR
jgi:hypothetical protein